MIINLNIFKYIDQQNEQHSKIGGRALSEAQGRVLWNPEEIYRIRRIEEGK